MVLLVVLLLVVMIAVIVVGDFYTAGLFGGRFPFLVASDWFYVFCTTYSEYSVRTLPPEP